MCKADLTIDSTIKPVKMPLCVTVKICFIKGNDKWFTENDTVYSCAMFLAESFPDNLGLSSGLVIFCIPPIGTDCISFLSIYCSASQERLFISMDIVLHKSF